MNRVKQFFRALFAKISCEDREYVKKHLPQAGQKLFFKMAVFDEAHAIAVAKTIETFKYNGDKEFLIRLALLHDIGRTNVGIFDKVFAVLLNDLSKKLAIFLSKYLRSLYVYYNHPQIGAELLRNAGFEAEAKIIERHHENIKNPPEELKLLQLADNIN